MWPERASPGKQRENGITRGTDITSYDLVSVLRFVKGWLFAGWGGEGGCSWDAQVERVLMHGHGPHVAGEEAGSGPGAWAWSRSHAEVQGL